MVIGNTEFLRLTLRTSLAIGVQPVTLVHGLQNHDELTYELVHWSTLHAEELFEFRGEKQRGISIAATIRGELTAGLTEPAADYNFVFTTNGIACTTTSVIAASLGIQRPDGITAESVDTIRRAHLLLVMFNAWQPGVVALSGWDLLGVLPVPISSVEELIEAGDTRWVERGAHDLMDLAPDATASASGMPRGRALYGSLPAQFEDPGSFVNQLHRILRVRRESGIALGTQVDVPDVAHPGMLVMVHRLDGGDAQATNAVLEVTVLNFTNEAIEGTVRSEALSPRHQVVCAFTGQHFGAVDDLRSFAVHVEPYGGLFLLIDGVGPEAPTG